MPTAPSTAATDPGEALAGEPAPAPVRLTLWQRLTGLDPRFPEDWRRPLPGLRGLLVDVPIAVLVVGMMVLTERLNVAMVSELPSPEADPSAAMYLSAPWAVWAIPSLFFVGFALRRLLPIPTVIIGVFAFLAGQNAPYGDYLFTQIACFVLIFSGAAWSRWRMAVTVTNLLVMGMFTAIGVGSAVAMANARGVDDGVTALTFLFSVLMNVLYVLAAAVLGANEYRRNGNEALLALRTAELRERTEALEIERRVVAEQAVRLDRVEIGRELHDVVAHHVSLMGLQAAAARRSLAKAREKLAGAVDAGGASVDGAIDGSPDGEAEASDARGDADASATAIANAGAAAVASTDTAEKALLAVEDSAREAIKELQLMLSTMRDPAAAGNTAGAAAGGTASAAAGTSATLAPSTVSVEQIPALVESVRAAGMAVSFREFGEPQAVSGVVGLTIYRILQEALTNVQKHAGPSSEVDVRMRWLGREVEVDVTNTRGTAVGRPRQAGGGRGVVGMRERATAIGGAFEAGPRSPESGGGFRVVARLPLGAA